MKRSAVKTSFIRMASLSTAVQISRAHHGQVSDGMEFCVAWARSSSLPHQDHSTLRNSECNTNYLDNLDGASMCLPFQGEFVCAQREGWPTTWEGLRSALLAHDFDDTSRPRDNLQQQL